MSLNVWMYHVGPPWYLGLGWDGVWPGMWPEVGCGGVGMWACGGVGMWGCGQGLGWDVAWVVRGDVFRDDCAL